MYSRFFPVVILVVLIVVPIARVHANLLNNPGFELGHGTETPSWHQYGDTRIEPWANRSGTNGLAFYGWESEGGIYQDLPAQGISNYTLTAHGFKDNQFLSSYYVQMRIEFLESDYTTIDFVARIIQGTNQWETYTLSAPCPPRTAWVRATFSFSGMRGPGGAFKWDDMELTSSPVIETRNIHYASQSGSMVYPYTNWATASRSIQAAVKAANTGDTILVDAGWFNIGQEIVVDRPVHIQGISGGTSAIVSADYLCRGLYVTDPDAVIEGLTIMRGNPVLVNSNNLGGGICLVNGGTIRDCVIRENSVTGYMNNGQTGYARGGGIYCAVTGLIENCTVYGNLAEQGKSLGGGIYCTGDVTVRGCNIFSNKAHGGVIGFYLGQGGIGGGIYAVNGTRVEECGISNNTAEADTSMYSGSSRGGGIYCASSTVRRCIIANNLGLSGQYASHDVGSAVGGGVYLSSGGHLDHSVIRSNRAMKTYSAAVARGGGVYACGSATIANCSIVGNEIQPVDMDHYSHGGGLYTRKGPSIENTILYYNTGVTVTDNNWFAYSNVTFSHCCTLPAPEGFGNITSDPMLVNANSGDFHLLSNSPCIDAGTSIDETPASRDLDNMPRPLDGNHDGVTRFDIGAYEVLDVLADSDRDGLSDTNEMAIGTSAALFDTDSDGLGDNAELKAGTIPTDSTSLLDMKSSADDWNGNGIVIHWSSVAGKQYTLYRGTNIESQLTPLATGLDAVPPINSYTDTTAMAEGPYYYRVSVE